MFSIYSIGDASYLREILSGVAAVVGTGNDFEAMLQVGLLIAAIIVVFQGLLAGAKEIQWQQVLVAWIIYGVAFAPRVDIAIEDAYSGDVYTVGDVPLGVAFTGDFFSTMGYSMTRMFETAYSFPGMTEAGWSNSLDTLMRLRTTALDRSALGTTNTPVAGSNFWLSWTNYVADCTTTNMTQDNRTFDQIVDAPDFIAQLRFDNDNYRTLIYTGGVPQNLTCADAWTPLITFTEGNFLPAYKQKILGEVLNVTGAGGGAPSAGEVESKIQSALYNLGLGANADDVIMTSVLEPIFNQGIAQRYEIDLAFSYATMVEDAMRQRAIQWTAEASLFEKMVRPLLTFIEGFMFAVTPLAAFLMMLGTMGMKLAGKYLLTMFWIQLWMPVLSIVNLYVHNAASGKLGALEAATGSGTPLTSLAGLYRADRIVQDYLATGGMLAASTPALSLMLVYGSAITATHLAGKLQGGDFLDEKKAAPDTMNAAPLVQQASVMTHDSRGGLRSQDAESKAETFMWNQARGQAVSSAASESATQSAQFGQAVQKTIGHAFEAGNLAATQAAVRDGTMLGSGQAHDFTYGSMRNAIDTASGQTGISKEKLTQVAGSLAMRYGGGGGKGLVDEVDEAGEPTGRKLKAKPSVVSAVMDFVGLGGGVEGKSGVADKKTEAAMEQFVSAIGRTLGENKGWNAQFSKALAADLSDSTQDTYLERLGAQHNTGLSREARESFEARQSFEQAQSMSAQAGAAKQVSSIEAATSIADNHDLREQLTATVQSFGLGQKVNQIMDNHGEELKRWYGGDEDRAQAHAQLRALYQSGMDGTEGATERQAAFDGILGAAMGGSIGSVAANPYGNEGVGGDAVPAAGSIKALAPTDGPAATADSIQEKVHAGQDLVNGSIHANQPSEAQFESRSADARAAAVESAKSSGHIAMMDDTREAALEHWNQKTIAEDLVETVPQLAPVLARMAGRDDVGISERMAEATEAGAPQEVAAYYAARGHYEETAPLTGPDRNSQEWQEIKDLRGALAERYGEETMGAVDNAVGARDDDIARHRLSGANYSGSLT